MSVCMQQKLVKYVDGCKTINDIDMETQAMQESDVKAFECCPPFDPAPWDDNVFEWDEKRFIRDKVLTAFHMPLNFGHVMKALAGKMDKAGAGNPDYMWLSDHTSGWNMDLYLAVDKEVHGTHNVSLCGRYYSKVYEGNFRNTGTWYSDFEQRATARNLKIQKQYMWYTTCPKCAKKYGKNYVVLIGRVD